MGSEMCIRDSYNVVRAGPMAQRQCRFIDFLTLPEGDKALANNCALQVSASASARAGVQDSEGCVTLAYCRCLFAMALHRSLAKGPSFTKVSWSPRHRLRSSRPCQGNPAS